MNPALMVGRESTGRHDAMHVRVADQRLAPRVEDAEHADLRAEMARVRRDLSEGGGAQMKEPRIQTGTVPIRQGEERMRQREDDVHIRHVEEIPLAGAEPALARLRLTLRTVPIATRVIGDGAMAACVAVIDMTTERGGSTARDRAQHGALLHAEPRMLLDEAITLRVEDIGHLHGGPGHDGPGFRRSRDRCSTTGGTTCSCSSGFGAACKWRRDRCR